MARRAAAESEVLLDKHPSAPHPLVADDFCYGHAYTGTLPMTWPRSLAQEPINVGDADDDPLFGSVGLIR